MKKFCECPNQEGKRWERGKGRIWCGKCGCGKKPKDNESVYYRNF